MHTHKHTYTYTNTFVHLDNKCSAIINYICKSVLVKIVWTLFGTACAYNTHKQGACYIMDCTCMNPILQTVDFAKLVQVQPLFHKALVMNFYSTNMHHASNAHSKFGQKILAAVSTFSHTQPIPYTHHCMFSYSICYMHTSLMERLLNWRSDFSHGARCLCCAL